MKYLLNTSTFLWSIFSPEKLSKRVKNTILDIDNEIRISVISFWEISLKYSLKKLRLRNVLPNELPKIALKSGFEILDLEAEIASSFYQLPRKKHKDPFDRLLVWQAIRLNYSLLSKDKSLGEYSQYGLQLIW